MVKWEYKPQVKAFSIGNQRRTIVVTIPKPIRAVLQINDGDIFSVYIDDEDKIVYERVTKCEPRVRRPT